jgi:AraC-like DNA-binding protein/mannose-6-phosphate isomerase-like protein (cupin superfamily)
MKLFFWQEVGKVAVCRLGASLLCGPRAFPVHGHDFPEVFWIVRGRGIHQINGEQVPLQPGMLVCIRPTDVHGFISDESGVLIYNVAIRPSLLRQTKRRYFPHADTFWNLCAGKIPHHGQISREQITELNKAFDQLSASDCSTFHGERFLLNLLFLIHSKQQPEAATVAAGLPDLPDWLAGALRRWMEDPENFVKGTPSLAKMAGRSPEHVARVLRQSTGKSPTDWLNEARMGYAAKQLHLSNRTILDIAMDCGFNSLGHFYAIFQKAHGCSPRSYRLRYLPRPI